jgi:phytoene desaturase
LEKTYEKHLDKIFEKKILSDDISYYLHRPSATDPNMAPEGQDAFYVLVPVQIIYLKLIGSKKEINLKI